MGELIKIGNLSPPIENCAGGIGGTHLQANLAPEQLEQVKSLPVSSDFKDQRALTVLKECHSAKTKVEIAVFPQSQLAFDAYSLIICALCLNTTCEFNRG